MENKNITELRNTFIEMGIAPNKALGQNFLIDDSAIAAITSAACCKNKNVLEIGCGAGAVTFELGKTAKRLAAVEIDSNMISIIESKKQLLSNADAFRLYHADFLAISKTDCIDFLTDNGKEPFVAVGNLPYYITTPIIEKLVSYYDRISGMVLMMQSEVVARLKALPKDSQYTPLSIVLGYMYDIDVVTSLSPSSFFPQPDVNSSVVRFTKKNYDTKKASDLLSLATKCFAMRRKTLYNNLKSASYSVESINDALQRTGISPGIRAEALDINSFLKLTSALSNENVL